MGMFDDVVLDEKIELPDGFTGRNFQTKDFECAMDHYRITAQGDLVVEHFALHTVPEEERGPLGFPLFQREHVSWLNKNFHGILNFYTYDNPRGITSKEFPFRPADWHEYNAKFTDGKLVSIEQIPHHRLKEEDDGGTAEDHAD